MTSTEHESTLKPIQANYFIRIPNVGDRINPTLISAISGRQCMLARSTDHPHLLAIGSMMASATPQSHIWGTGVMHPEYGIGVPLPSKIYALRGKLSHEALTSNGIKVKDIPLGDPAFLAPQYMGIQRSMNPKYNLGVVSHYADRQHPAIISLLRQPGVIDLNVHDEPDVFLARMAECQTIASTSLHGLIFAEGLGIPNLWAKASNEIGGGSFKFQDWFSLSNDPQLSPFILGVNDKAEDLGANAELHDFNIDRKSLVDAFPNTLFIESNTPAGDAFLPTEACRHHPLPCFLISFNRGPMLRKAIKGLQTQLRNVEIIIHDNGSNDSETVQILHDLQAKGSRVVFSTAISSPDELDLVNETIESYFQEWAEPSRYIVSDCDIDMGTSDPGALGIYDSLLNIHRKAECVGPMLRIRDIPKSYPLYTHVMNRHIEQFWQKLPLFMPVEQRIVAVLESLIDTTFAMHRAGEPFRRLKSGLRVYEPFEALHLDWYSSGTDQYSKTSDPSISHWQNKNYFELHKEDSLHFSEFFAVRVANPGGLEIYVECLE